MMFFTVLGDWWLIYHRVPDGKVCLNESGELAVTKFAVEPVSCCFGRQKLDS